MRALRLLASVAPVVVCVEVAAQATPPEPAEAPAWSFSAYAYSYFVPEDRNYVQPTFTADREWLHLEARYNYESQDSASLWIGYNWSVGETVSLELTPMLGGVFGDTTGIAPGCKASLAWRRLAIYSEGEYVFDTGAREDSFFYNWSELTAAPAEWLRLGLVTQRTRAYQSEREIERGVLVGFSHGNLELTGYLLDPDLDHPTAVLAIGVTF